MAFTAAQKATITAEVEEANHRLDETLITLGKPQMATEYPVTVNIRAAIEKLLDALLICGAAIED